MKNGNYNLLEMLRDGGMLLAELNVIFCSLVVTFISNCLTAWGGYLNLE